MPIPISAGPAVSRSGGEEKILGSAASITRRRRLLLPAAATDWPRRTVRIVLPYAAGGGTDIFVRTLAEGLRPILGQAVVVENRPGANGVVGSEPAWRRRVWSRARSEGGERC